MTARDLITALYVNVTFPPGQASERFVHDMMARPKDAPITPRAERFAWRIAFRFRRQLPREIAEEAVRRKVDHRWEQCDPKGYAGSPDFRCAVCGYYLTSERDRNAPCPGPPEPKPAKEPRKRKAAAAPAAEPAAPQDSLWGAD